MLGRVRAGEISNAEAATELGLAYGTWAGWKALHAKRAGVIPAPIARAAVESTSTTTGKRGRGRPVDPARLAMLERVQRGELGHDEAAAELGLTSQGWMGWLAYHERKAGGRAGDAAASVSTHGREVDAAEIAVPASMSYELKRSSSSLPVADVAKLVARVEELERFGKELRERMRELVALV